MQKVSSKFVWLVYSPDCSDLDLKIREHSTDTFAFTFFSLGHLNSVSAVFKTLELQSCFKRNMKHALNLITLGYNVGHYVEI